MSAEQQLTMLGTGMIGGGMAQRWLASSKPVRVWNRSPEKTEPYVALGATAFATPAAATTGAARIHLALSDDAAVDALLDELCREDAIGQEAIVVDHTTTSTVGTRDRANRLRSRGIRFLHCPVFMSPAMCVEGKGLMLVSGPPDLRAAVAPHLAEMTGQVIDLGDRPDAAAAYKLFGNAMIVALGAGISDVFAIARANGIAPSDALSLFSKFSPTVVNPRSVKMAQGEFTPASFALTMARKDVRLMIESAGAEKLGVLPAILARMDELIAAGYGDADVGALAARVGSERP
jgi:3-hydroxyisobutyrate dehydrogenase-like beta-hydroxyacid dehydrogenase